MFSYSTGACLYQVRERVKTDPIDKLENLLGYQFINQSYLDEALTHRSLGHTNYERLEYLGDALLGFIIAEALYSRHPGANEGELTRLRASLVKGDTLAMLAKQLNLGSFIRLGGSELKSGGWRRNSILANSMEALIGAMYLDGGMDICRDTVLRIYDELLNKTTPDKLLKDPKTRLQEYLQARQQPLPEYTVIREEGEAHQKTFIVRCTVPDTDISVQSHGRSKRVAEQAAAQIALEKLNIS